jgi:thymidylate synthase
MKFEPVYYGKDELGDAGLDIVNPSGSAGIVTLWSDPVGYQAKLAERRPDVFGNESKLVALTSLYGNGLPQMLANLAHNPQISRIAVTGGDNRVVPSSEYLMKFLAGDVELEEYGGVLMNRINGSNYYVDARLRPEMFDYLDVMRFDSSDLDGVADYVMGSRDCGAGESDRVRVELKEPEFSDFPSDLLGHNIAAKTPLRAWREVLWHLDRFGRNVMLKKGVRRMLPNLDVNIKNPSFEKYSELERWGFSVEALKEYQKDMLNGELPDGSTYSYGNRLGGYYGDDALKKVGEMLRDDPFNRHGFISLWDTGKDLLRRESSPCFTDAYFVRGDDGNLMMTAGFRTHNAASAWLVNMYGLRAIQEKVADEAGMKPGGIHLRSRWIGIDPSDPKIAGTLGVIKAERRVPMDTHDPKGYYSVGTAGEQIVVGHFSPDGVKLEEIVGSSAGDVKNKLRQIDGFSSPDHAMYVGMELAKAEFELKGD